MSNSRRFRRHTAVFSSLSSSHVFCSSPSAALLRFLSVPTGDGVLSMTTCPRNAVPVGQSSPREAQGEAAKEVWDPGRYITVVLLQEHHTSVSPWSVMHICLVLKYNRTKYVCAPIMYTSRAPGASLDENHQHGPLGHPSEPLFLVQQIWVLPANSIHGFLGHVWGAAMYPSFGVAVLQ